MTFKDYRDIIRQMERDMQQLTDDVFRGYFDRHVGGGRFWVPSVDIHETQESLLVKCELAGVKAEDLQVSLSADDKTLTIAGIRKEARDEQGGRLQCHQLEVYFGPFEREVAMPPQVRVDRDRLSAAYKDGFLIVSLPKLTQVVESQPRRIPITGEEDVPEPTTADTAEEAS
ncbi:MAG: Hsp20/alpha crystallin family protein [Capsulimonadaceae bacterium]|nr:Hsp20/alpha crystallin family protein [Capsulimonadaceae bacterium]